MAEDGKAFIVEEEEAKEDLVRTRRPDGKEVINDAALGTWSTNPDYQQEDSARGDRDEDDGDPTREER